MDDALFLAMCSTVLFISGLLILFRYDEAYGLSVIALALLSVLGAVYYARRDRPGGPISG